MPVNPGGAPFLSVVIPTQERADRLSRCLTALSRQTLPPERFEVLVADDGSATDLEPVVARYAAHTSARLLRLPVSRGPAAARNAGWRAARGDAVVFLDDDVEVSPEHLAVVAEILEARGAHVAGVEGPVRPEDPGAAAVSPFAHTLETRGGGHTCNIVYWRSALEAAGGFDEGFPLAVGEDYDLVYRVVRRIGPIAFEPRLMAVHAVHGERTMRAAWRQRRSARPSLIRLFLKHPDHFPPRFVPRALHSAVARLLSRPSIGAVASYFLLQNAVALAAQRHLLPRHPLRFLTWTFFLAVDCARICADVPALARHHHAVSRELGGAGAAVERVR